MCERERKIEREINEMYLGDSNRQPQPSRESQKAWFEMASDNHSRIFTTLFLTTKNFKV